MSAKNLYYFKLKAIFRKSFDKYTIHVLCITCIIMYSKFNVNIIQFVTSYQLKYRQTCDATKQIRYKNSALITINWHLMAHFYFSIDLPTNLFKFKTDKHRSHTACSLQSLKFRPFVGMEKKFTEIILLISHLISSVKCTRVSVVLNNNDLKCMLV